MKVKTSVTLSADVLAELARLGGSRGNRSRLIETALREFIRKARQRQRDAREIAILNKHSGYFKQEMEDILDYQDI